MGEMSYVELLLCDNKGAELILPFTTWDSLMHKRIDVERLAHSATTPVDLLRVKREMERQSLLPAPIKIQDLTIDVVIMSDFKLVRFAITDGDAIYMAPPTVLHLFDFEDCIDHMHLWLCENTYLVNEKFKNFVSVLQRNAITNVNDAAKAIRESDAFDSKSLIDCELLTCALYNVFYDACNK